MFIITLIIMYLCFCCANAYINRRTIQALICMPLSARITISLLFGVTYFLPLIILFAKFIDIPNNIVLIIFNICSVWMIFAMYMALILLLFDGIKRFILPSIKSSYIYALIITTATLTLGYINHLHPKVNRIDIAINKPIIGDTIKVVSISDLHLGYNTGKEQLKKFVSLINAENPDVILIAGDLIDNNITPLYLQKMYEELNELQAPMGIYMAPGNHEYISGIEKSRYFLEKTKIKLVCDNIVTLPNGIQLILRDDAANKQRLPIEELVSKTDSNRPIVLIDHQPLQISKKDSLGIDLQISGHTHNGQVWPGNLIVATIFEQSKGYRKWTHSHVYISSGLSLWGPPFRIGTQGDFAVFKIYSTQKK